MKIQYPNVCLILFLTNKNLTNGNHLLAIPRYHPLASLRDDHHLEAGVCPFYPYSLIFTI